MQELHKSLTQKSRSYKKWHKFSGHETYHWLILAVLVIFAGMVINNRAEFIFGDAAPNERAVQAQELGEQIPTLTKRMLELAREMRKALPEEREEILAQLVAVAEQRKALVGQAIKENPRVAVNTALNNQLRAQMPQEIRDKIEEKKTIRGTFEFVFADAEEYSDNELSIVERGSGKRYRIHLPDGELPNAKTDDEVSVLGVVSEDEIAATTEEFAVTSEAGLTAGRQLKTAVILFNFSNNTNRPITAEVARTRYFTGSISANALVKESSFGEVELVGKNRIDGDVFGYYTINDDNSGCDRYGWGSMAEQMAQADGFTASGYDLVSYVHAPTPGCGEYLGWATVGGSPGRSWIPDPREWVVAHELGHNMGAYHASGWACKDSSGNRVSISNNCDWVQQKIGENKDGTPIYGDNMYADFTNVMAKQNMHQHQNYHKGLTYQHFGWLGSTNSYTISPQQQPDNIYTIAPIEMPSSGIQALRIPRGKEFYYLEFRQPVGYFDSANRSGSTSWLAGAETNGVIVRLAPDYSTLAHTKLIDTSPATGWGESAIAAGQTFRDPDLDMNITVQSVAPEGAKVRVTFGTVTTTCTQADPGISITPSSVTGLAGSSLSYVVKVTNRDSSVCGQSTYSVTPTLPAGFLQSPSSIITDSMAPGGSYSQTVIVTSPDTAADGTYTITQRATNTAASAYTSTITASYVISLADTQAPQVTISSPADGATVSGTVTISADITDNVGVTKSAFLVDGTRIGLDSSAPYSVQWDSSSVAAGSHKILVKARDAAGNVSSSSITVTTSDTSTSDTQAPQVSITSPADGATATGQIAITASASDNIGVTQVVFRVDGTNIASADTTAPYSVLWDSASVPDGSHNIVAVARDAFGNTADSSITVTTFNITIGDSTLPQATILSPTSGSGISNGQNNVEVTASDNVQVSRIDILLDGEVIGACTGSAKTLTCSSRFLGNKLSSGTHFILVRARDAAGNIGTAQHSVTK